ncbi:hypothetical protein [Nocardioides sp. SYSU DS0663]|uniref:hypothetical protein n=1 Tax=Nocardioides sp. SYSU DS0663 TaxID=3416445 RepID=UPI003F4C3F8D
MSDGSAGGGAGPAEVVVDPEAVHDVLSVLDDCIDRVDPQQVQQIPSTAFGSTAAAVELGEHTALAREAVVESLTRIRTGLGIYRENVHAHQRDVTGADEAAVSGVLPLTIALESISRPISQQAGGTGGA